MVTSQSSETESQTNLNLSTFKYSDDLYIDLIATNSHKEDNYDSIRDSLEQSFEKNNHLVYEIALIEGFSKNSGDSKVFTESKIAHNIQDPFLNPLSFKAFKLFQNTEHCKQLSTAEAAARYVALWLAYAVKHNHSFEAMDQQFKKVFEPYKDTIPDYLSLVKPYLNRFKKDMTEKEYTDQSVNDFNELMDCVNHESMGNIKKIIENVKGSVLIYCGKAHRVAVVKAIELLQKKAI